MDGTTKEDRSLAITFYYRTLTGLQQEWVDGLRSDADFLGDGGDAEDILDLASLFSKHRQLGEGRAARDLRLAKETDRIGAALLMKLAGDPSYDAAGNVAGRRPGKGVALMWGSPLQIDIATWANQREQGFINSKWRRQQ
jgi:hypothetical protein